MLPTLVLLPQLQWKEQQTLWREEGTHLHQVNFQRVLTGADVVRMNLILWGMLDLTRRMYGHPKQMGALTLTYFSDDCKCFPLGDCTWFVCMGVNKGLISNRSNWFFAARVGVFTNWREGSSILSLRHGPEANDVLIVLKLPFCQQEKL